jgi:omega-6 fatty acid desaturase (delta-12 desaturase)
MFDLLQVAFCIYIGSHIDVVPQWYPSLWWAPYLLYPIYWWVQGVSMTGLWVLAHECGHGGFSDSKTLNDFVGWVVHSALLVPYFSWQKTHSDHHKHTNQLGGDTVFEPPHKSTFRSNLTGLGGLLNGGYVRSVAGIVVMLTMGWPGYLIANLAGLDFQGVPWYRSSHFDPRSPYFSDKWRSKVVLSDVGLLLWLGVLYKVYLAFGAWAVFSYYFVPYLWVNHWLVLITYLQHTDPRIPHYSRDTKKWNFERGAISTVDRDYGWLLNHIMHHIQDSHVAHHIFSDMPYYGAIKATPYLKKKLGKYYVFDGTHYYKACLRSWMSCQYVADHGQVSYWGSDNPKTVLDSLN